jgi:hypothetical protein
MSRHGHRKTAHICAHLTTTEHELKAQNYDELWATAKCPFLTRIVAERIFRVLSRIETIPHLTYPQRESLCRVIHERLRIGV